MEPIIGERYRVMPINGLIQRRWHGHEVVVSSIRNGYVNVDTGPEVPWGAQTNRHFTSAVNFMKAMELVGGPDENIPEVW